MLLAIDIGNSATKFGVFDGERLVKRFAAPTIRGKSAAEIWESISPEVDFRCNRVVISSVVVELIGAFVELSEDHLNRMPIVIDSDFDFGLEIAYDPPSSAGTDRLVAASAASAKYGKPCIVCSLGTATTVDAVTSDGRFIGGAIAPGINTLSEALFLKTSKLPRVGLARPASAIGGTTADCIASGIYFGYIGLVRELIARVRTELDGPAKVVATGGFLDLVVGDVGSIDIADDNLILEGLRKIATGR